MLDVTKLIEELDRSTKVAKQERAVKVAGKKVEFATTNPDRDKAVEKLKEEQDLLKQAKLEGTPLFISTASHILKCHQGDEIFPCVNSSVCSMCSPPEHPKKGVIERGYHLEDDPAVWICDRYGYPKVIGCQCPKCTTMKGCKYFYYWEPGSGYPFIGKKKHKNVWIPVTSGWDKGIKVKGRGKHKELIHYSIPRLLPTDMYEESPTEPGMCSECLYWDHRLQCPAHIQGNGYWILKRYYPKHLEWAVAEYKPAWKGKLAPMLLEQRNKLLDVRHLRYEELILEVDRKLQKDRINRILATEAPPDKGEGRTHCDLNDHLTDTVDKINTEWKAVMKDKSRTTVRKMEVK